MYDIIEKGGRMSGKLWLRGPVWGCTIIAIYRQNGARMTRLRIMGEEEYAKIKVIELIRKCSIYRYKDCSQYL